MTNIHFVNNTPTDIFADSMLDAAFADAYVTRTLPDELADLFSLEFVEGLNDDGTVRMIINPAETPADSSDYYYGCPEHAALGDAWFYADCPGAW